MNMPGVLFPPAGKYKSEDAPTTLLRQMCHPIPVPSHFDTNGSTHVDSCWVETFRPAHK